MKKIILSLLAISALSFGADNQNKSEVQGICAGLEASLPGVKRSITDAYSIKVGKKLNCEDIPSKDEIQELPTTEQYGLIVGLYYSFATPQPELSITKECGEALYSEFVTQSIAKSENKMDKMKDILRSLSVDGGIMNIAVCQKLQAKK